MLKRLDFSGNPWIGVYCVASEDLFVASADLKERIVREMSRALEVDGVRLTIGGSPILGALLCLNTRRGIIADFADDEDLAALSQRVRRIDSRLNAVGNNILCNDRGAVVNPDYSDRAVGWISEALGVPAVRGTLAGIRTVGSAAVATNRGVLCHPHARASEIDVVRETLQVPVAITTANYGAAQIGACLVANTKGAIVGSRTTPIEMGRIEEGLGYL